MKKTIPTSIAHTLFYIEEDTYPKLDTYLSDIRTYFSSYEDQKEIIEDIEGRIREQFVQFSDEDKTERIISEKHVDKLIKSMGWPKEFGEFAHEESHTSSRDENRKSPKRLYRNKDNAVIGGVASGIAAYFGIDPVIVRILFVLMSFSGGVGIPIYIILWFAVPSAETATEKLQMQGEPVNLREVKKMVEEKIQEVGGKEKIKTNTKNFFENVRDMIIKLAHMLFKIASRIIGVMCKIASICGAVFLLIALGAAVIPGSGNVVFTPYHTLPYYYILVTLVFIIGLVPLLLLNKIGNIFLGRKMFTKPEYPGVAFAIWITAIILASILFFSVNDEYVKKIQIQTGHTQWQRTEIHYY